MFYKPAKAVLLSFIIWFVGFLWGSIVFLVPTLKSAAPLPFISSNPWISFPILLVWVPLSYFAAMNHLRTAPGPRSQGLRLGFIFSIGNFVLDLLLIVFALNAGFQYFLALTVFSGYALLLLIPCYVGGVLEKAKEPSR